MSDQPSRAARLLARAPIHRGFVRLEAVRVAVRSPAGEAEISREVHAHGEVAALLPVDPARRMAVLVRQFRVGPFLAEAADAWPLEMPAGLLDAGETAAAAAARETEEETGLAVTDVAALGAVWSSPGTLTERVQLFWGRYAGAPAQRVGGLAGESEMVELVELPLRDVYRMSVQGGIDDAKTALAVLRLAARSPELFA